MQSDRNDPGSPSDWLKRAKSNLIRARQPKPEEVFWEDICFDAQQAAEKSLKALITFMMCSLFAGGYLAIRRQD